MQLSIVHVTSDIITPASLEAAGMHQKPMKPAVLPSNSGIALSFTRQLYFFCYWLKNN